jgi:hypothetical protein
MGIARLFIILIIMYDSVHSRPSGKRKTSGTHPDSVYPTLNWFLRADFASDLRSLARRAILLSRFLPKSQQGRPVLIQLRPESPDELRTRLRDMSDLELRRFGQRARQLSDPKMNLGATEPHVLELEEARAEWRRRTVRFR